MINPLVSLLYSRKFWLAVVALVQTLVFHFVPGFPSEIWKAINGVLLILITTIAVEDAAEKMGRGRDGHC